jgi:mono/diheme cytochrome c family protein
MTWRSSGTGQPPEFMPEAVMHHRILFRLFAVLLACVWGVALGAQQPPEKKPTVKSTTAQQTKTLEGADTYASYCAVCHGKSGKGDGPAAPALKAPLSDLTTIAQRHNGAFPRKDVEETITGVHRPVAHGTVDMPMWGPAFHKLASGTEFDTLRMHNLLDHLEKMQAK